MSLFSQLLGSSLADRWLKCVDLCSDIGHDTIFVRITVFLDDCRPKHVTWLLTHVFLANSMILDLQDKLNRPSLFTLCEINGRVSPEEATAQ